MRIDGLQWFVGALLVCGAHALYLRAWYRESQERWAWWQRYFAESKAQHEEFMRALARRPATRVLSPIVPHDVNAEGVAAYESAADADVGPGPGLRASAKN